MKRLILTIMAGLLLVTPQAFAKNNDLIGDLQQEAEELNTPAEAAILPVKRIGVASGPCMEWVSERGWDQGKNSKSNSSYFFVQSDSALISAPPGHPNYVNSRQNAYVKAMMNAKGKILKFLEAELKREVTFDQKSGEFSWENEAALKNAEAPEESAPQAIKRKTLSLINATLDEKLKEKGVDPNSNDPADQEAVEEIIQEVRNSKKFSDIAKSASQQQLKGVRRVFVNESIKEREQGEICMVALYSPKTMAMADAIFSDPSLAPVGTPSKPIRQQIPDWNSDKGLAELLSTFGTEMLRDENGQFHVIAYAQSAPQTKSKTSQKMAIEKASLRAMAEIRSFAQEYAVLNDATENYEKAIELANAMQDYESGSAYQKTLSSMSGPAKISGIRQIGVWGAEHPLTGQIIIGSIVGWTPGDAQAAKQMKSQMGAKPRSSGNTKAKKSNHFKSDSLKAKGSYQGSASGGSSEEDF
jgi:hypothetical protein